MTSDVLFNPRTLLDDRFWGPCIKAIVQERKSKTEGLTRYTTWTVGDILEIHVHVHIRRCTYARGHAARTQDSNIELLAESGLQTAKRAGLQWKPPPLTTTGQVGKHARCLPWQRHDAPTRRDIFSQESCARAHSPTRVFGKYDRSAVRLTTARTAPAGQGMGLYSYGQQ